MSPKSNHPRIRICGQRSIPSTFIRRTSTVTDDDRSSKKLENPRVNKKRPAISLSDFLDRKLQKTSAQSKFVQDKERPFLSPGTSVGANQSIDGANADPKTEGSGLNGILDVVLEQFKHSKDDENNICLNLVNEVQSSALTNMKEESQFQNSSIQKNSFPGSYGKPPAPKGLVVLGGDPKLKQAKDPKSFIRKEKLLPLYNHYASGSGWWDSDMEGIDNDEVGFNEVWEGVGSATIGGLDWH